MGGVYKRGKPSRQEYKDWLDFGWTGSWEKYCESAKFAEGQLVFYSGDAEFDLCKKKGCLFLADNLCDYPVGNEKTCDRLMCPEHSHEIGEDMHYCDVHYKQWIDFKNVTELPKR